MKGFYFSFLIYFTILHNTASQPINEKIDKIILSKASEINGPGGVFLVSKRNKIIYHKGFGKANIELAVDMKVDNVFQLGSLTKQFTAIAILILEEQGKLKTEDKISKYIADYPNGDKITVHHLLTHTSGIKDFTTMKGLNDISLKEMTPKDMLEFFKNEPLDFNPGEKFDYNNSGYFLLGYLIELISGGSYQDFIQEKIFTPIQMNSSYYASDKIIVKHRAYGYRKKENVYENKRIINFSIPYSSGALMSTTSDMLRWQNALNQNILLKFESISKAFNKYTLNNGEEISYGYGWHIKDIDGVTTREHGGSIFGFKSMGIYIPSEDIYVLGLTNCDCISPTQMIRDIAKLALESFRYSDK